MVVEFQCYSVLNYLHDTIERISLSYLGIRFSVNAREVREMSQRPIDRILADRINVTDSASIAMAKCEEQQDNTP